MCLQVSDYEREVEEMKHMTRQEFVASLRRCGIIISLTSLLFFHIYLNVYLMLIKFYLFFSRKSSGFSRGASIYRGVTRSVIFSFNYIFFFKLRRFAYRKIMFQAPPARPVASKNRKSRRQQRSLPWHLQ